MVFSVIIRSIRHFLGFVWYYHWFIPNFADQSPSPPPLSFWVIPWFVSGHFVQSSCYWSNPTKSAQSHSLHLFRCSAQQIPVLHLSSVSRTNYVEVSTNEWLVIIPWMVMKSLHTHAIDTWYPILEGGGGGEKFDLLNVLWPPFSLLAKLVDEDDWGGWGCLERKARRYIKKITSKY